MVLDYMRYDGDDVQGRVNAYIDAPVFQVGVSGWPRVCAPNLIGLRVESKSPSIII